MVQPALSSYHSESVAMTTGLERLLNDRNFNITDSTVGIFTDSHGLCDHLMKLKREDTPVEIHTLCLVRQLNRLLELQPKQITIHWIPSHKGIGDNELADEQAEKGHKSKNIVTIPYTRNGSKRNYSVKPRHISTNTYKLMYDRHN